MSTSASLAGQRRRRLGRALQVVGVAGAVVAVVASVTAVRLLQRLHDGVDAALAVSGDSLVIAVDSIDQVDAVAQDARAALEPLRRWLGAGDGAAFPSDRLGDIAATAEALPARIADLRRLASTVAEGADAFDRLGGALGGNDVPALADAARSAQEIADLLDGLEQDADDLSAAVAAAAASPTSAQAVDSAARALERVEARLEGATDLLGRYRDAAADGGEVIAQGRRGLPVDLRTSQGLALVMGAAVAAMFLLASRCGQLLREGQLVAGPVAPGPAGAPVPTDDGDRDRAVTHR